MEDLYFRLDESLPKPVPSPWNAWQVQCPIGPTTNSGAQIWLMDFAYRKEVWNTFSFCRNPFSSFSSLHLRDFDPNWGSCLSWAVVQKLCCQGYNSYSRSQGLLTRDFILGWVTFNSLYFFVLPQKIKNDQHLYLCFLLIQVSENIHLWVVEPHCEANKWNFSPSVSHFTGEDFYTWGYSWLGAQTNVSWTKVSTVDGKVSFEYRNLILWVICGLVYCLEVAVDMLCPRRIWVF